VERNILNGAPFEEAWWKKVVWACGLEGEIEGLCASEAVGHGAGAISGGQKQRIVSLCIPDWHTKGEIFADFCLLIGISPSCLFTEKAGTPGRDTLRS
jgi:hypothetical protein